MLDAVAVTAKLPTLVLSLSRVLHSHDFVVIGPFPDRSLKAQLRLSNTFDSDFTVIIGERELSEGKLVVKDMKKQLQKEEEEDKILEALI